MSKNILHEIEISDVETLIDFQKGIITEVGYPMLSEYLLPMLYQNAYEFLQFMHSLDYVAYRDISDTLYTRDGMVFVDEYSYLTYTFKHRIGLCK